VYLAYYDLALPMLGALIPHINSKHEYFYFVRLPFLEDIRPYSFNPVTGENANAKVKPNREQLAATNKLIDAMDLEKPLTNANGCA